VKTTGTRSRISAPSFAGDRRSPAGWVGSVVLHGAIIIGTLFTVSHTLDIADQAAPVVPIDLVTIAQKTNIRASAHHMHHIAPTPTPPVPKEMPTPPQVQPQPQPAPPPPQPQPAPPKQAEAEPLAEAPQPVIPKHRPQPAPAPKLQEVKQPEEKPQEDKKKSFDVDKVLALLNKVAPSQAAAPDAPEGQRNVRGFGAQNAMTADLVTALRNQIYRCWSPPVGAPHPVIVDMEVSLNPDGSVAHSPQLLENSNDPYFRAAAEAARRALYACAPYHLPADQYNEWHEISDLHFDPSTMMGDQ
jgi:outer membrane biosynthesis protein TonB